jgi:hypothetical protein
MNKKKEKKRNWHSSQNNVGTRKTEMKRIIYQENNVFLVNEARS